MRRLVLLLFLLPGAQACELVLDDDVGDQQPPFPADQYDLIRFTVTSGTDNLTLRQDVAGLTTTASAAQYYFNFDHDTWTYLVACRAYAINVNQSDPDCSLERTAISDEGPLHSVKHLMDLPVEMGDGWMAVHVPFDAMDASPGDATSRFFAGVQFAVGFAFPPPEGEGFISPIDVDSVEADVELALCGPVVEAPLAGSPGPMANETLDGAPVQGANIIADDDREVPMPAAPALLAVLLVAAARRR